MGTNFAEDRFGNSQSAVYVFGNENSYINLGNYPALKPVRGSISLWLKIEKPVYSGTGDHVNPILITKCADRDDFYEAYSIYYVYNIKRIVAACSHDSSNQPGIAGMEKFSLFTWHHLVVTYDNHFLSFYIDGKLEGRSIKDFETTFNPLDSVVLGTNANKKNNRFTTGILDDIAFYDSILDEKDVDLLYHAENPNKKMIFIGWLLLGLAILAGFTIFYLFLRYRFRQVLKKEKHQLQLVNRQLESELRVHRALMNPHFIFNSMNTLHHYILSNNIDKASNYLVKFSKLVRKILDSNQFDLIPLDQEIELIHGYLEIESLRFKELIEYKILLDPGIVPSSIIIPIMMLQPFIENSIWHGLRDKQGEKLITISFSRPSAGYLLCIIEDNGTGRKIKKAGASEKKSLATGFVLQRLALLNKIHAMGCSLDIIDKPDGQGTIVKIVLPILNK